jgi:hypothetical protein
MKGMGVAMTAKYRAKRIDNGKWVYGMPLYYNGRCWIANGFRLSYYDEDSLNAHLSMNQLEVDPATVGQWTGKKDKNGKEIYLGDFSISNDGCWVVEWVDGGFAFVHARDGDTFMFSELFMDEEEITGNIHDNPELLK